MAWNDAPVAVKELSATTLDAASIGESYSSVCQQPVVVAPAVVSKRYTVSPWLINQRTSWRY